MKVRCVNCRRKIHVGMDVVGVTRGVFGQRRFVPFDEEPTLLCSDDCARLYFTPEVPSLDERIP